jgi:predicted transcriptional regulator
MSRKAISAVGEVGALASAVFDPAILRRIDELAKSAGKTRSQVIRELCAESLGARGPKQK